MKTITIRMKCGMYDKTFAALWSADLAATIKDNYTTNFMHGECHIWIDRNYHGIVNYNK